MKQFLESQNLLQTVVEEANRNSQEAQRLVSDLSVGQMSWTSSPDRWSIAQCLDHLAVTSREFNTYFTEAINRGRDKWPITSAIPYKPTRIGGWLIKQVVPETTRKVPAPKVFRPSQSPVVEGALEKFLKQQNEFLHFVREAEAVDYNKTRLRSPVTPFMRYSLADAFVVTIVHGWRHLAQARRVREISGFPI
ncbi:MAG: DinB family protein [Acidobacteriota bacterium]